MWSRDYASRLRDWSALRSAVAQKPLIDALTVANDWWLQTPWRAYFLHWDDHQTWPTAWELLAETRFCELARSLGIMYTLMMVDRSDIKDLQIIQCNLGHLVQINRGKYILNWAPGEILNIHTNNINIQKSIDGSDLNHLIG